MRTFFSNHVFAVLALILFSLFFGANPCVAAQTDWQGDDEAQARLLTGFEGTKELVAGERVLLGLEIKLAPDWHSYWRSVGDSGTPPVLDWKSGIGAPPNAPLRDPVLHFPTPHRFMASGVESIGYKGRTLYPIEAVVQAETQNGAQDGKQGLHIEAALDLLICKTLCVPKKFLFHLALPAEGGKRGPETGTLEAALAELPASPRLAPFAITSVTRDKDKITLEAKRKTPQAPRFDDPDLFVETEPYIPFLLEKNIATDGTQVRFTLRPDPSVTDTPPLETLPLTVTLTNGPRGDKGALEQKIAATFTSVSVEDTDAPAFTAAFSANGFVTLCGFILLAFVGGFILNLMPCVLPVLSIKIMSVLKHSGATQNRVRKSFLSSAGGILFSFWGLALVTFLLREGGQAVGWGFHFQHPNFLVFLALVLTVFAANLWGLFEITLPPALQDQLTRHTGQAAHSPHWGDFATGALATLLATPCSAPFLGTAVGFALVTGGFSIFAIFTALGLGMALPYLVIAAFPRLATKLPKAGAWMETVKKILSLLLGLTALWLLDILAAQSSATYAGLLLANLVLLVGVIAIRHKFSLRFSLRQIAIAVLFAAPFVMLALLPADSEKEQKLAPAQISETATTASTSTTPSTMAPPAPAQSGKKKSAWATFDPAAIDRAVKEGKTVFVNVTADWCLTCKVNERYALKNASVQTQLFDTPRVIAMQADWTKPSETIHDFLKSHGRSGVPFNIVYGPNAPEGLVLPELLTPATVLQALEKATDFSCRMETKSC